MSIGHRIKTIELKIEPAKNVLASADTLIRWAIVLNSAAAAGLMTFIGNAIDNQELFHSWESFGTSLILFSIGVFLGLLEVLQSYWL